MKLQLDFVDIVDVQFGDKTCVRDGILFINKEEAEKHILADKKIGSVSIEILHPGDQVRLINLQDIVQPRCKVTPEGGDFPGYLSPIHSAGSGHTVVLRGTAVAVTNPDTDRGYSAFLDMGGPVSKISRYGHMPIISLEPRKPADVECDEFDVHMKRSALNLSVYLARAGIGCPVNESKIRELDLWNLPKDSDLPRVAYYYQMYTSQHDHKGVSEPFFYGTEIRHMLPTIIHPNEVLDGGIIDPIPMKGLDTYSIQNHAVINELYDRHGKDLLFCGLIVGAAHMDPVQRERRAMIVSGIAKEVFNADGIIITKVHGGMPHLDLASIAEECEKKGIKSVLWAQGLNSSGTIAENALFQGPLLNAVIYNGVTVERIKVPFKAERIIGGTMDTKVFHPDHIFQQAKDELVETEEFLFAGIHDHTGAVAITGKDY